MPKPPPSFSLPPGCPAIVAGPALHLMQKGELSPAWWLPMDGARWPQAVPVCDGYHWYRWRGLPGAEVALYTNAAWLSLDTDFPARRSFIVDSPVLVPPDAAAIKAFCRHQATRTDVPMGDLLEQGFYWISVGGGPAEIARFSYDWTGTLRGPLDSRQFTVLWGPIPNPPLKTSQMSDRHKRAALERLRMFNPGRYAEVMAEW